MSEQKYLLEESWADFYEASLRVGFKGHPINSWCWYVVSEVRHGKRWVIKQGSGFMNAHSAYSVGERELNNYISKSEFTKHRTNSENATRYFRRIDKKWWQIWK